MSLGEHHDRIGDDAHDDRRHSVQYVRGEADYVSKLVASVFGEVNARADSDRHAHTAGDQQNPSRTSNRVRHAAAGFANWFWGLREESPVDGADAFVNQISEIGRASCRER